MIDTSSWKEFRVGDLFRIEPAKGKNQQELIEGDDVPYIAASKENNGFNRMVSVEGHEDWVSKGNCLQFVHIGDAAAGHVNYIPSDFIGMSGKSSCAYNDRLNEYNGLFIASIIVHTNNGKYSFKDSWTGSKVSNTIIKLPATSDGQPDWDYMESYMKTVMEESEKSLENLRKVDDTKHLIDVSGWDEFDIAELFDMSLPKGDLQVKKVDDGDIPLITPSNFNNGMIQRISEHSKSTLYGKGSLTVDMFGNAYYQEEDFFVTAHGHVNVLIPKMTLNVYTGTFLASTIRAMFFDKYGFNEMCTQKVLKAESIWLPITSTGEPDWQYMEDYMKQIMDKSEQIVSDLQIGA